MRLTEALILLTEVLGDLGDVELKLKKSELLDFFGLAERENFKQDEFNFIGGNAVYKEFGVLIKSLMDEDSDERGLVNEAYDISDTKAKELVKGIMKKYESLFIDFFGENGIMHIASRVSVDRQTGCGTICFADSKNMLNMNMKAKAIIAQIKTEINSRENKYKLVDIFIFDSGDVKKIEANHYL